MSALANTITPPIPDDQHETARSVILDALNFRHACKRFDPERWIAKTDVDFLLEAGRLSPSSIGLEHWSFVVVQGKQLQSEMQPLCGNQPQIGTASIVFVILAKTALLQPDSAYVKRLFARHGVEGERWLTDFYRSFAAGTSLETWSIAQCHIAAANMMTAAAAVGIDSCPIGLFDTPALSQWLGIDSKDYTIALVLPFGYRANPQPPRIRLPIDELVEYRTD